jgi:hypothetical protein
MDIANELGELLKVTASEMGTELTSELDAVTAYAAERATHLSTIVGQPGFMEAVRAEADSVALRAGISTVSTADSADARLAGIIQGVLGLGARALAAP